MQPQDDNSAAVPTAAGADGAKVKDSTAVQHGSVDGGPRLRTLLALALPAALLAGVAAWAWGELMLDYYKPSEKALKNLFNPGPLRAEMAVTVPRNVAIAFGAQGALLGLLLGLVGGLCRRSVTAGAASAVAGAVAGALLGAVMSYALVPLHQAYYDPAGQTLVVTALVRCGIWAAVGAVAAVSFGRGLGAARQVGQPVALGVLGGLAGTFIFETLNALVFTNDQNDQVIPSTQVSRLIAYLCVALAVAVSSVVAATDPRPATVPDARDAGGTGPGLPG